MMANNTENNISLSQYYKKQFYEDLSEVTANLEKNPYYRLSFTSFYGRYHYREVSEPFRKLEQKEEFLLCLFLIVLFDQAVHSSNKELYSDFENITQYPKLVGVLSGYWHMAHPRSLLLIVAMHNRVCMEEFSQLINYYVSELQELLLDKIIDRANKKKAFLVKVYKDILADEIFQGRIHMLNERNMNYEIYSDLIKVLRESITAKLDAQGKMARD